MPRRLGGKCPRLLGIFLFTLKEAFMLKLYKEFNVPEWLNFEQVGIDIFNKKYRFDEESDMQWLIRVSGGNDEVARLIFERKFLFGGRTLANRNTGNGASYSNCYSSGYVQDDLDDISDVAQKLIKTFRAQGGQGISLSKLRPKDTLVGSGTFTSDGIIPFLELYNQVTATISQGSSRKGALMVSLDVWHKEIEAFIDIKGEAGKITKANLSVEIDDAFMRSVDKFYKTNKHYKTGLQETFDIKRNYSGKEISYTVTPIKIYKKMMKRAYNHAEPGVIYTNRFRNYNIMQNDENYKIVTGNPCGEQPLPPDSACNLGSINLSPYVLNAFSDVCMFDFKTFEKDVGIAIRALNEVIEEGMGLHPMRAQREMAERYLNVGLGIMGLGDALFKLNIDYGSQKALDSVRLLMRRMFRAAVFESNKLAAEKGSFPGYSPKIFESEIMVNHFTDEELINLQVHGLRNCSLLSIAPTGTIGTMFNISTGMEPFFSETYWRKTENLSEDGEKWYELSLPLVREYEEKTGRTANLVTAKNIPWKARIAMQAAIQNSVDTGISSTVNLPQEATLEEIELLYLEAWKKGLKGITIYRSGCEREGILVENREEEKEPEALIEQIKASPLVMFENSGDYKKTDIPRGDIIKTDDSVIGRKRKIVTGCGSLHVEAWFDPETGNLMEVFFNKGSSGGCHSFMIGTSRLTSIALRSGAHVSKIIDQMESVPTCPAYAVKTVEKRDTSKGNNCLTAISIKLKEMQIGVWKMLGIEDKYFGTVRGEWKTGRGRTIGVNGQAVDANGQGIDLPQKKENSPTVKIQDVATCKCGQALVFESGCMGCKACGWSKCD